MTGTEPKPSNWNVPNALTVLRILGVPVFGWLLLTQGGDDVSMASLDDTTRIRRLTSMLARKGYSPQLAFDVVRAELEAATV